VRQRWVAGPEDQVVLHVGAELGFQCRPHVDFGEYAKPVLRERLTSSLDRLVDDVCTVVDIAIVMTDTFLVLPGLWSVNHDPVHTERNRR